MVSDMIIFKKFVMRQNSDTPPPYSSKRDTHALIYLSLSSIHQVFALNCYCFSLPELIWYDNNKLYSILEIFSSFLSHRTTAASTLMCVLHCVFIYSFSKMTLTKMCLTSLLFLYIQARSQRWVKGFGWWPKKTKKELKKMKKSPLFS